MTKRDAFGSFLKAAARAAAAMEREKRRLHRAQAAEARRMEAAARRAHSQLQRDLKEAARLQKLEHLEQRQAEVDGLNAEIQEVLHSLQSLLVQTLSVDDCISFASLRLREPFAAFVVPAHLHPSPAPAQVHVEPPRGLRKLLPGASARYQRATQRARKEHEELLLSFNEKELSKKNELTGLRAAHDRRKVAYDAEVARRNQEVDEFETSYRSKDSDAVVAYNEMVLERSEYPDAGFPQKFRVAYNGSGAELVVEYDLPDSKIVPEVAEYRYVRARDAIESKPRKPAEIKKLYQDVVASIAIRTMHELLEADQADAIHMVTFTGIVDTIDPTTGREVRVPVISIRASKADFIELRLDRVDRTLCLKNLGAHVSARPDELQAIRPIVEFEMVDKRFIEQGDALSGLESRTNLLDLSPSEFETLVANLFGKMGLETKLTRASRDGGVDAVAFDARPVVGGKVVIQAKRYRDTVGVSAVRDLYGTMMNEGANKGILVSTSGYGMDAYTFSKDKPIELIDGGGLLYLLREHAQVQARIAA